jgi:hypothetical protein
MRHRAPMIKCEIANSASETSDATKLARKATEAAAVKATSFCLRAIVRTPKREV